MPPLSARPPQLSRPFISLRAAASGGGFWERRRTKEADKRGDGYIMWRYQRRPATMFANSRAWLVWTANTTIMSFHADVSAAACTHCGTKDANLPFFCFFHKENKLPFVWVCTTFVSFVCLRCCCGAPCTHSQVSPSRSACGLVAHTFGVCVGHPRVIYLYECVCASWLLFCGLLGCWMWARGSRRRCARLVCMRLRVHLICV